MADTSLNGRFHLVVWKPDRTVQSMAETDGDVTDIAKDTWNSTTIAKTQWAPSGDSPRLYWQDMDNNGGLDLVAMLADKVQQSLRCHGPMLRDRAGRLRPE